MAKKIKISGSPTKTSHDSFSYPHLKEPNHLLHEGLRFRLTEQQSHLDQFVPAALGLLQYKAQLQIKGLNTNGKKVYSFGTKFIKNDVYSGPA